MRKKILSLIFFTIILSGCGDQNVNVKNSGGFWHEIDGVGTIKKAIIGSEKDLGIAMEFFDAYTNLNSQRMVDLSADVVKFHPGEMAGIIDVDATNTAFIDQIQSTFKSINRLEINIEEI